MKIIRSFLIGLLTISILTPQCLALSEINFVEDETYLKAINFVVEEEIFQGYPDGTFKENQVLNRAELLKILMVYTIDDEIIEMEKCFSDVSLNAWYAQYACRAKRIGIIHGYPDGTFRGDDQLNLAEAIKMLFLVNSIDYTETKGRHWYKASYEQAQVMNIIPPSVKSPASNLTRGEAAELLARFLHYQNGKLNDYLGIVENDTQLPLNYDDAELIKEAVEDAIGLQSFNPLRLFENENLILADSILLDVPFTSQAPTQDWSLPYAEACEEASLIMVDYFDKNTILDVDLAVSLIQDIVNWEEERDYIVDISAEEMQKITEDYLEKTAIVYNHSEVSIDSIKYLLQEGYPVIIPIAGREIGNPYYRAPGPPYHVVVIVGYNEDNFIINDPGTHLGENLEFDQTVILDGIHNWTGSKSTILDGEKAMLVLERA